MMLLMAVSGAITTIKLLVIAETKIVLIASLPTIATPIAVMSELIATLATIYQVAVGAQAL